MNNPDCKRILAIHDLSGFGHTSLMAAIPLLYRLGIRVCALPTTLLAANTDYPDPVWMDLSPHQEEFLAYWQQLGLRFDAIYSGFLASPGQAESLAKILPGIKRGGTLLLVDPVMADNGSLYSCYDASMVPALRELVRQADIITPNYTEALLLAGWDPGTPMKDNASLELCRTLAELGPRHVVITSLPGTEPNSLEVLHYDNYALSRYPYRIEPGVHPGAGDCFATLLLAGCVKGHGIPRSLQAAVRIMTRAIAEPLPIGADWREGIALERVLEWDLHRYYRN